MRVASLISLKQGEETIVEAEENLTWSIQAVEDENKAEISLYNSISRKVEARMIIVEIVQSGHPMFEPLDNLLEQMYSFPRFGLIFIEHVEYKIEMEAIKNVFIGEIIDVYFNGYVMKANSVSTDNFSLNKNGLSFNYLNEAYLFFQNPSHMM